MTGSYARLLRTAYLLTGEQAQAEDLVQVALTKTLLVWSRLDRSDSIDRYTERVMVNAFISERRRRWWRELPVDEMPVRPAPDDEYERVGVRDALRRALASLPARQRAAVILRFYEDLSEAQTADVLGCSLGTAKSLTSRGLHRLRQGFVDVSAASSVSEGVGKT